MGLKGRAIQTEMVCELVGEVVDDDLAGVTCLKVAQDRAD
jgi:hypothetical protein